MPSAAPTSGSHVGVEMPVAARVPAWVAAQRNSAVSSPSRPTARTATTTSDQRPPSAASSILPRSSPLRPRAARAIQKIIQVTKPTATIDRLPPISSCASKVRPRGPKVSAAPKARLTRDGERDPGPDPRQEVAPVGLDQVGDEDAHDEGRLQPLAQPDQVVRQHSAGHYT